MKSIFEESTYHELLQRLDKINEKSNRLWGRMTPAQMAWHCKYPLQLGIENKNTGKKGNPLIQLFFKKSMYNDKPWRKNLPTAPQLKATEEKDYAIESVELRKLIKDFHELKNRNVWNPHPIFGKFTKEQWGQMQYKHLDHHFRQFGV
ncbi:DUF1569 domain-containing protein [Costertonia aggregata]|uniref:DUF1569 domain-containing protein n=1 Tax=Costertonia aggregata TaxID=343403 RepID=A0A7H9AS57_9FLAO|nr:DUF1569 domain-containing protein [Costertonia aggregata]QLG46025.1 DUF1569 domain-containing protein [Costertonia aggregata]